jgi:anaerobic glycerol-3-phosphate dehydrogenase
LYWHERSLTQIDTFARELQAEGVVKGGHGGMLMICGSGIIIITTTTTATIV